MDEKNYTEVLINGNVYTLGGAEDPEYLQKVAAYINEKIAVLKAQPGFTRQNKDYQEVMIYLNSVARTRLKLKVQIAILDIFEPGGRLF